eukprot:scaffold2442_cov146-Cylindrotheca_fusiformis.AAC.22
MSSWIWWLVESGARLVREDRSSHSGMARSPRDFQPWMLGGEKYVLRLDQSFQEPELPGEVCARSGDDLHARKSLESLRWGDKTSTNIPRWHQGDDMCRVVTLKYIELLNQRVAIQGESAKRHHPHDYPDKAVRMSLNLKANCLNEPNPALEMVLRGGKAFEIVLQIWYTSPDNEPGSERLQHVATAAKHSPHEIVDGNWVCERRKDSGMDVDI